MFCSIEIRPLLAVVAVMALLAAALVTGTASAAAATPVDAGAPTAAKSVRGGDSSAYECRREANGRYNRWGQVGNRYSFWPSDTRMQNKCMYYGKECDPKFNRTDTRWQHYGFFCKKVVLWRHKLVYA